MDGILMDKAMWDVTRSVFPEEAHSNKIYKSLQAAHKAALEVALTDARQMHDESSF